MIKKIDKTLKNIYGLEEIKTIEDKPCLLTVFPLATNPRTINGYFNQILYLLQIKSSNVDSNYAIKNMPFDILTYTDKDEDIGIINQIPENNIEKAKIIMRNLNILSYCDGNRKTAKILYSIYDKLKEKKYNEEEIKDIMSEIFVIQIIDNYYEKTKTTPLPFATTYVVQDIYDYENNSHIDDFDRKKNFIDIKSNEKTKYILYKSFGENSLSQEEREHEFKNDYIKAPIINAVISICITKALQASMEKTSIKEISINDDIEKIISKAEEYIKQKNKIADELNKDEMEELNKIIYKDMQEYIVKKLKIETLTNEENIYMSDLNKTITEFMKINPGINIEYQYNICTKYIDEIHEIYSKYQKGEIIGKEKIGNLYEETEITREIAIENKFEKLNSNIEYLYSQINCIKYPDTISSRMRKEMSEYIELTLKKIKERINNEKFQMIINETMSNESKEKNK